MLKLETINWKDSNLAMFGSDLEKKIKEASAGGEHAWDGVGKDVALRVWRVEKFKVVAWPKSKYGKFHKGDSYIVLNTYKKDPKKPKLSHDVYIWIGDESTQDEYGTAAYKMVELDDKLKRAAVEHRETQGHESEKFCSYFNNVTYLEGGVESGFNHVEPDKEHPQLYHIKGNRRAGTLRLTQEPLRKDAMNSGDVFILTTGASEVYLWVGKSANMDEKAKGVEVAQGFCNKGKFQTLDEGANDSPTQAPGFWKHIQSEVSMLGPLKRKVTIQDADDKDDKGSTYTPALYRTPDSVGGSLVKAATAVMTPTGPTKEKRPKLSRGYLQEGNAYLLDTGFHVYIWLGSKSKAATRNNAVHYAHSYFKSHKRPTLSVTVVKSKHETEGFQLYFVDGGGGSGCACAIL